MPNIELLLWSYDNVPYFATLLWIFYLEVMAAVLILSFSYHNEFSVIYMEAYPFIIFELDLSVDVNLIRKLFVFNLIARLKWVVV